MRFWSHVQGLGVTVYGAVLGILDRTTGYRAANVASRIYFYIYIRNRIDEVLKGPQRSILTNPICYNIGRAP